MKSHLSFREKNLSEVFKHNTDLLQCNLSSMVLDFMSFVSTNKDNKGADDLWYRIRVGRSSCEGQDTKACPRVSPLSTYP